MNELQIFDNAEFGQVRTIAKDNEPMFCLSDVCKALEIKNATDVAKRLDADELTRFNLGGQSGETNFITESGLYAVILRSDKPNAKKFRKWVTSEVLPSIRKNGGYIAGQETLSDDELLSKALMVAQRKIEEKNQLIAMQNDRIEEMRPKEIFADAVSASDSSMLVRDLAKIIKQNGVPLGEKRFYKWLRENGYICKGDTSPTQKAMELGLFEIVVRTVERGNKLPIETKTTKVTGKGQQYFINKFLGEKEQRGEE